jgi:diguanylate cyclase (GGDEF)-like protein/PAS domain S-box-containing protein
MRRSARAFSVLRQPAVVITTVMLAIASLMGVAYYQLQLNQAQSHTIVASNVLRVDIATLDGLSWEGAANGSYGPQLQAALDQALRATASDAETLGATGWHGQQNQEVVDLVRKLRGNVATQAFLLGRGDVEGARAFQRTDVAPAAAAAAGAAGQVSEAAWSSAARSNALVRGLVCAVGPLLGLLIGLGAFVRARTLRRRQHQRIESMIGHAADPFLEFDALGIVQVWSPRAEDVFGWRAADIVGTRVSDFLIPPHLLGPIRQELELLHAGQLRSLHGRHESSVLDSSGAERQVEVTRWTSDVDGRSRISVYLHDVTSRHQMQHQLRQYAEVDTLTGLTNRRVFEQQLEELTANDARSGGALIFLDLDNFKTVNDTFGHCRGDDMLVATAERLQRALESFPSATAARFGGDEFAVLLPDASAAEARWLAANLVAQLRRGIETEDQELAVSASLGLVLIPSGACQVEELMRDADLAMYAAKSQGRNQWVQFEPEMYEAVSADARLEAALRSALRDGDLKVHYQPIMDLRTGRPHGVEALARWQHPDLGEVPPDRFIALAEQRSLIIGVGDFVLRTACRQLAYWQRQLGADAPAEVSVNVSVEQLRDRRFADRVAAALADTALAPNHLTVEVTESAAMHDTGGVVVDNLVRLRTMGVSIAIDDFGTGHSSLSRLREMPVDALKIDQSFLRTVDERGSDPLVRAIVTMAEGLQLKVVVEGVETETQSDYVRWLGATHAQGYLFSRPKPPLDLAEWWTEQVRPPGYRAGWASVEGATALTDGLIPAPREITAKLGDPTGNHHRVTDHDAGSVAPVSGAEPG